MQDNEKDTGTSTNFQNSELFFSKLNLDVVSTQVQDGEYSYALNANSAINQLTLTNDYSNFLNNTFPTGYKVIGFVNIIPTKTVYFFLVNPDTKKSQIGYVVNQFVDPKLSDNLSDSLQLELLTQVPINTYVKFCDLDCLNFDITHRIFAEFKTDNISTYIYFTDNFNAPRYFDILVPITSCDKIKVFKDYTLPKINILSIEDGGNLFSGVYQFTIAYANELGDALTQYIAVTNPIPIYSASFGNYKSIIGDFTSIRANKSIAISIDNLSPNFDYYNLVVIETTQSVSVSRLVGTFNIGVNKYLYNGKTLYDLSLAEVLSLRPHYTKAKNLTQGNDYLMWSSLEVDPKVNLQKVVNNIKLFWQTEERIADNFNTSYKNPKKNLEKGYMRDEVYAFGIVFILNTGRYTDVFPLIGPSKDVFKFNNNVDVDEIITNSDVFFQNESDCKADNVNFNKRWQVYNTAFKIGTVPSPDDPCSNSGHEYGEFGYYESLETYPNNTDIWGDLAGKPIRHFRFPDCKITHIHDSVLLTLPTETSDVDRLNAMVAKPITHIYPLGVRVDETTIIIPPEFANIIKGYKLVRANRHGNKSIIAKGLLYNCWRNKLIVSFDQATPAGHDLVPFVYYPNYPYNDLRPDPYYSRNTKMDADSPEYYDIKSLGNINYPLSRTNGIYKYFDNGVAYDANGIVTTNLPYYHEDDGQYPSNHFSHDNELLQNDITRNIFSFHSPETHFAQPALGSIMKLEVDEIGYCKYKLTKNLLGSLGVHGGGNPYLAQSYSDYNSFSLIPDGQQTNFLVNQSVYTQAGVDQFVGSIGKFILDGRESSVILRTNDKVVDPQVPDLSRQELQARQYGDLIGTGLVNIIGNTNEFTAPISSYYVSLKNFNQSQYFGLLSLEWVDTGYNSDFTQGIQTFFGGDIYISRFSLKIKNNFFRTNNIGTGSDEAFYTTPENSGLPVRWQTLSGGGGNSGAGFYAEGPDQSAFLFYYGVPYYFVESEFNTDLRSQDPGNRATEFYPALKNLNLDTFFQELYVPIRNDNYYLYNPVYSKQNLENFFTNQALFNTLDYKYQNRVIYSKQSNVTNVNRSFLNYRFNDFHDFPESKGNLTAINPIENNQILARFEDGLSVYNAVVYLTSSSPQSIQIGDAGMFAQKPQELYNTDSGYGGSQHASFLSTPYGHFYLDAKRGHVLNFSSGINEISVGGTFNWFNDNLPFNLSKHFPTIDIDNIYDKIGISMAYDNQNKRLLITKKDYIPLDSKITLVGNDFILNSKVIHITDTKYFSPASWTISFDLIKKAWVSFHSFIPDYYIESENYFQTGMNTFSSVWNHNILKYSRQVYYGKLYPFIVEAHVDTKQGVERMKSVSVVMDVLKYNSKNNFKKISDVFFNKAIIYNNYQGSGMLELINKPVNNLSIYNSKITTPDLKQIFYSHKNHSFSFNEFYDIADNGYPMTTDYANPEFIKEQPIDKVCVLKHIQRDFKKVKFIERYNKVRLINDKHSDHEFQLKFVAAFERQSI